MSAHRFFLTGELPAADGPFCLPLDAADLHHARDVLRLRAGEVIEVVETEGRVLRVRISDVSPDGVTGRVLGALESRPEPRVTLVQGVAKGDKMDSIVRQAVEIGVHDIVPVLTERTIVRIAEDRRAEKAERWRRISKSAAEQSHRTIVPAVRDVVPLRELRHMARDYRAVFVLWEEADGPGLVEAIHGCECGPADAVALVVGPEGGLSAREVEELVADGAVPVTLGATVLRTETAAVVGTALAVHALGGLGSGVADG